MLYYLDTNVIIFSIEGGTVDELRAKNHLAALGAAGHRFGISDLVRTECLVHPLKNGSGPLLLGYEEFFVGALLITVPVTAAVHTRAAMIRAKSNYGIADALHLAAAVEHRFDRFLTNDQKLAGFTDIRIELLPQKPITSEDCHGQEHHPHRQESPPQNYREGQTLPLCPLSQAEPQAGQDACALVLPEVPRSDAV